MPAKRAATAHNTPTKKKRRGESSDSDSDSDELHGFGAATADDEHDARLYSTAANTATHATRWLPPAGPCPPLSSLATRVAATAVQRRFDERTKARLLRLPDHIVPRLFAQLRAHHPTVLSNTIISTYFLRGDEIVLNGDLPGVTSNTIPAIARLGPAATLRSLELSGFQPKTLSDDAAAKLLAQLPALEKLVLKDSKAIGPLAVTSAAQHCPDLRFVNVSYTQATTDAVALLMSSCIHLETLKLAGIPHLSKTGLKPVLALAKAASLEDGDAAGRRIMNIKLRSLQITTEPMYRALLSFFPRLRRLDLSHTNVHFNAALVGELAPALEKLAVNHTPTSGAELCQVLGRFDKLQTLNIGALGIGSNVSSMHSTTMFALSPTVLSAVTDILVGFERLGNVSLGASARIAEASSRGSPALQDFVARVGRKCKFLDLGNIPALKSRDLCTLVGDDDAPPPALEHLVLSGCPKIDDDAAAFISSCVNLRVLDLESTSIRTEAVFQIIDRCPKLESLNLTGCRGVRIQDRRRIFEAWAAERRE